MAANASSQPAASMAWVRRLVSSLAVASGLLYAAGGAEVAGQQRGVIAAEGLLGAHLGAVPAPGQHRGQRGAAGRRILVTADNLRAASGRSRRGVQVPVSSSSHSPSTRRIRLVTVCAFPDLGVPREGGPVPGHRDVGDLGGCRDLVGRLGGGGHPVDPGTRPRRRWR